MESTLAFRPLNQLGLGEEAQVLRVNGIGLQARRIMALGLSPGALVRLVRRAPLGYPLEVAVAGCRLVLRCEEANSVLVAS